MRERKVNSTMKLPLLLGLVMLPLLVLLISVPAASAQAAGKDTASVEQRFAAMHTARSSAADSLLAATAQRPEEAPPTRDTTQNPPDVVSVGSGEVQQIGNRAFLRVQQLRSVLEPILREEGLPTELAALVLIESGGQATALSPKGARGVWQFMPDTARRYGLAVDTSRDERVDVVKSTRAAARYLRDLHRQFNSWPLALAAYNAGEDAVQRALGKAASAEFERISQWLPMETRNYVPAVLVAMKQFGDSPEVSVPSRQTGRVLYAAADLD